MEYSYHNHTHRCGHATGTEREYVEKAIANGIKYMGFSEHMPFTFPDGFQSWHRMKEEETKYYFSAINDLKEEYRDKIEIKIGFEMECYPLYFEQMIKKAIDFGAEYLILGHHYLENEYPDFIACTKSIDNKKHLIEYTDSVITGIKSGYFTYVAHPDVLNCSGNDEVYAEQMRRLCKTSLEYNIPLEINFLGIRGGRHYPNNIFWKIAGEEGSPVVFGFDAHESENAYDAKSLKIAENMVKKYNLNYIGRPHIIPLVK